MSSRMHFSLLAVAILVMFVVRYAAYPTDLADADSIAELGEKEEKRADGNDLSGINRPNNKDYPSGDYLRFRRQIGGDKLVTVSSQNATDSDFMRFGRQIGGDRLVAGGDYLRFGRQIIDGNAKTIST